DGAPLGRQRTRRSCSRPPDNASGAAVTVTADCPCVVGRIRSRLRTSPTRRAALDCECGLGWEYRVVQEFVRDPGEPPPLSATTGTAQGSTMESVDAHALADRQMPDGIGPYDASVSRGSPFSQLLRSVKQAGLLERRSRYYAWKITLTTALWVGGWIAFVIIGDSWWQVGVAVLLAGIFTQLGFLGHDAGHRQVFDSRRANDTIGVLLANLGVGLSYGWWI